MALQTRHKVWTNRYLWRKRLVPGANMDPSACNSSRFKRHTTRIQWCFFPYWQTLVVEKLKSFFTSGENLTKENAGERRGKKRRSAADQQGVTPLSEELAIT